MPSIVEAWKGPLHGIVQRVIEELLNLQFPQRPLPFSRLSLSYSEHLGATGWTYTLSGWFAVFHRYTLGVLHLFFGSAFNAIGFHLFTPFRYCIVKPFALHNPVSWEYRERIQGFGKTLDLLIKKH
jgi:hypothetical protein